jgi:hypothetical protein
VEGKIKRVDLRVDLTVAKNLTNAQFLILNSYPREQQPWRYGRFFRMAIENSEFEALVRYLATQERLITITKLKHNVGHTKGGGS